MRRVQRTLLAAAVLATALSACGKGGAPQQKGPPPLAVDVAQAHRSDIATFVALDGQIAPVQEATLSTPQSGNVIAVYVNEGQRVSRGQLIAKLDDATLRAQLAQAQATLQANSAALGSQQLQAPVTAAQASSTVVNAQQQVDSARNSVQTAQAALQSAKATYEADQTLLKQGYVSQTQFEAARAQYVQAQQAYNNARDAERQTQVAYSAARQQGSNAVPIQGQAIAQSRAQVGATNAQIRLLQTQIGQTAIVAPFDGVVTQRLLDPGAFSSPNQPVARVSQVDPVFVNVNVPDDDLAYVRAGTGVTFTSSSVPGRTFHASIVDVNATPTTGTLSYRARMRVPNPDQRLRGGMLVSVIVRKEMHPGAIVVPRTAVFQTESGANVFTVVKPDAPPAGAPGAGPPAGGNRGPAAAPGAAAGPPPPMIMQAKVVPVQLGLQTDTLAEVRSALIKPGTTVITTRPDALQDKSKVAITQPGPGSRRSRGAQ